MTDSSFTPRNSPNENVILIAITLFVLWLIYIIN